MLRFYKKLALALILTMPFLLVMPEAEARGRGGGGFSRSSGRSSWGRSSRSRSSSRSSSWKRSSPSSKKKWGSSSTSKPSAKPKFTTAPKSSKAYKNWSSADKKLASKAKSSGTSYKNRTSAVEAFKSKNAQKYTSKYAAKPASRPNHVPQTYKDKGGKTYNVTYNQGYGSYGYMGVSGSWIMYDAMGDAIIMSMLMRRSNYYYPGVMPRPMVGVYAQTGVVHDGGMSPGAVIGLLFLGVILVVFVIIVATGRT